MPDLFGDPNNPQPYECAFWVALTDRLTGKEYTDEYGCAELVREVYRAAFQQEIPIPSDREWRGKQPEYLQEFGAGFTAKREDWTQAWTGDILLMKLTGSRYSLGSHVGIIVCEGSALDCPPECLWVLHNLKSKGVVHHPAHLLPVYGLSPVDAFRVLPTSQWTCGRTPSPASGAV